MTDAPAAITAQLVDVRNVAAHKSVRLELHVPAEQAGLVMAAFGWPTMADPVPVALARLQPIAKPDAAPATAKERTPFSELPYAQQAAMRCSDGAFNRFIADCHHDWLGDSNAAESVRHHCGVQSRSEIIIGTPPGDKWAALDAEFFAWSRGMR